MVRIVKAPEERREEIIHCACQLFLKKGYEKTTMQHVMGELQIAKGTIYHYFRSKEELLDAVIESIAERKYNELRTILDQSPGNGLERLFVLSTANQNAVHEENLLAELHKPVNAGMHTQLLARMITNQARLYGEVIEQGCKEGLFTTKYPRECAEFLLSAISFLTDFGIYNWSEEELTRRINAIPSLVEQQLGAPEGSFKFLLNLKYH